MEIIVEEGQDHTTESGGYDRLPLSLIPITNGWQHLAALTGSELEARFQG